MYNLSTHQEIQISTSGKAVDNPVIHGDRIVWVDERNGRHFDEHGLLETHVANFSSDITTGYFTTKNYDIYMYDLSTSRENQITTNAQPGYFVAIYGNKIVWTDYRNGDENRDIYMCTLTPKSPIADFSASSTSGNAPLNVTFIDKSTGMPIAWNWNFGDGTNSTEQNPKHTFSQQEIIR
jgi:beta propeller repeat protein